MILQTLQVAQMAILEENQLKILLPTQEAFPRWISFTDFEKVTIRALQIPLCW